ncbi:hypothetical protein NZA98_18130, partial [Escherichia coli]|nr:hypothetical protein [Escherichia coli]
RPSPVMPVRTALIVNPSFKVILVMSFSFVVLMNAECRHKVIETITSGVMDIVKHPRQSGGNQEL